MLVSILVAVVIIAAVAGLITWIRRARSCQRITGAPAGEPELVCYGGVMCRSLVTSGTLVRLDLLDWGVRMRGIPGTRWIVPRWEARYEELASAELVSTQFSRIAVWFRVSGEQGGVGFLSDRSQDILAAVQKHDVPVNRAVQRIRGSPDMYGKAS